METQAENLLRATLSVNADFETKKLLKAGRLWEAASNILNKRRKSLVRQQLLFSVALILWLVPYVGEFLLSLGLGSAVRTAPGLPVITIVSLIQVPTIIDSRASITRLETVLAMWLLGDTEAGDLADESLVQLLVPHA